MKRKITLCILLILIIMCVTLLSYEKINKTEINNANGMFAIFLEEEKDSGKYQKSNLKTWPTEEEYTINMLKSYCENGSILRWNNETKKISLKVTGTDKCYVYFDKAEIGSEKHPHLIQTIEDLVRLSNDVNGGKTYTGEYFLLTNDLDFNDPGDYEDANRLDFKDINGINGVEALIKELTTGSGFIPIGNSDINSFQGIFDGGNHIIDNIHIENTTLGEIGLFGNIINSIIKNLTISGNIHSAIAARIGLTGTAREKIEISNCQNKVDMTSDVGSQSVGGLIGDNYANTTISNSQNYGNLSGGNNVGGLIGWTSSNSLVIKNSANYGNITNNLGKHVGGLLGRDNQSANQTTIISSHNEGNVEGQTYVGGIMGYSYGTVNILDSYNGIKDKSMVKGMQIGGIIGYSNGKTNIKYTYNAATIKNYNNDMTWSGGLIGTLNNNSENIIENSYNTGNVEGTYRIGGLIGLLEANTIINKSYNEGNVIGYDANSATDFLLGGLVGHIYGSSNYNIYKITILNSYNKGNLRQEKNIINSDFMGGLVYVNNSPCDVKIINSFNTSDVISKNATALGIIEMKSKTMLNNVFNIGKVQGINSYGIGTITNLEEITIENTFYENSVNASNLDGIGTAMTINDMKQQTFIDELNQNVESINLAEIDESLKDYKLSKWELGKNGYPKLINE